MLDISRLTVGTIRIEPSEMDLEALVVEIVERHSEQFRVAGIEVKLSSSGATYGYWDRLRLDQVLSNLFLNAIKYAPRAVLEVRIKNEMHQVTAEIEDHGPGIKKEDQEKIFERFARKNVDVNIAGLGLGLYIAKQVVVAHGGSIEVESKPAKGACFKLTLPKLPPKPAESFTGLNC